MLSPLGFYFLSGRSCGASLGGSQVSFLAHLAAERVTVTWFLKTRITYMSLLHCKKSRVFLRCSQAADEKPVELQRTRKQAFCLAFLLVPLLPSWGCAPLQSCPASCRKLRAILVQPSRPPDVAGSSSGQCNLLSGFFVIH